MPSYEEKSGLLSNWPILSLVCNSVYSSPTESGDGDPTYGHNCSGVTNYVDNISGTEVGITISANSSFDGTSGSWEVEYTGPGGTFTTGGAVYRDSVTIEARIINLELYSILSGSRFRLIWDEIQIYVNGVYDSTLGGSSLDMKSTGCGPNYVPIIGIPIKGSASCSASRINVPTFTYDPCDPGDTAEIEWETILSGYGEVGWTYNDGVDTVSLPTLLPPIIMPPLTGSYPFGLSISGIVETTDTSSGKINCYDRGYYHHEYESRFLIDTYVEVQCNYGGHVSTTTVYGPYPSSGGDPCTGGTSQGYADIYKVTNQYKNQSGTVRLIPNLEKALVRIGTDFRLLTEYNDLPEVRSAGSRTNGEDSDWIDSVVYPYIAEDGYNIITNAVNWYETQVMSKPTYVCMSAGISQSNNVSYFTEGTTVFECPPPAFDVPDPCPGAISIGISCSFTSPTLTPVNEEETASFVFPSSVSSGGDAQENNNNEARYLGTWPNPHWHIGVKFFNWEINSTPIPYQFYWGVIREQFITGADRESASRRNSIVTNICENNAHTPWQFNYFRGRYFLGSSRFKILETELPTSKTLSSSDSGEWSSSDTTLTSGASGITLSAFGATSDVRLKTGSWNYSPYLLPLFAKSITVSWSGTRINTVSIYGVGYDDEEVLLGTSQTTLPYLVCDQVKYAGSWAIDNGVLLLSDVGTDLDAAGISSTIMADPITSLDFQLGQGTLYKEIKFLITYNGAGTTPVINWPTFNFNTSEPTLLIENSKIQTFLWGNYGVYRYGQWTFWDGTSFNYPPDNTGLSVPFSIIDGIGFDYVALKGTNGSTLETTIETDLATYYTAIEGQTIDDVDSFSNAIIMPFIENDKTFRTALISSIAEVPPLACFPFKKRNAAWQNEEDYSQVVYEWVQDKRLLIHNKSAPLKLYNESDDVIGSQTDIIGNYAIWTYYPNLTGSEGYWKIKDSDGNELAELYPWHGFTALTPGKVDEFDDLDVLHDKRTGEYYICYILDGDVYLNVYNRSTTLSGYAYKTQITNSGNNSSCCIVQHFSSMLMVAYIEDGSVCYYKQSTDFGKTFGDANILFTGTPNRVRVNTNNRNGVIAGVASYYNSGTSGPSKMYLVKRQVHSAFSTQTVLKDESATDIQLADPPVFDFSFSENTQGAWVLTCKVDGETDFATFISVDDSLLTWRRI